MHTFSGLRSRFTIAAPLCVALALGVLTDRAIAQTAAKPAAYPAKPITLVIPAAAGGGLDVSMRHVAKRLGEILATPVLVENRPSVNLLIGTRHVAAAPADGYTLLAISNTFVGAAVFDPTAGYEPFRDFAPIAPVAQAPNLLLVNSASGISSARNLVERAKQSGAQQLAFGSAGIGSSPHVAAVLFGRATATSFIDVPYKGAAPALLDLLGGRIAFLFDSVSSALPHVKAGTLRALAATTAKRSALVPEVPTMMEALGLADYDLPLFYGIAAPAKTPPDVINALHAALTKSAADNELREQFAKMGFELQTPPRPDEYTRFLRQQFDKLGGLKQ